MPVAGCDHQGHSSAGERILVGGNRVCKKATQQSVLLSLNPRPVLPHMICGDKKDDEDDESYAIDFVLNCLN